MAKRTMSQYNKKKDKTLNTRSCGWELSYEEYCLLYEKSTVCDYTGDTFSNKGTDTQASIERIDKNLPYRADNCCMVTVKANRLKDLIDENNGKLSITDLELIKKIKETLQTTTKEQLTSKYFGERKVESVSTVISDKRIATSYLDFIQNNLEDAELVSFAAYKKKFMKKTCDLTGATFGAEDLRRVFSKKDLEAPWGDTNIQVVCSCIKRVIHSGINKKQLQLFVNKI